RLPQPGGGSPTSPVGRLRDWKLRGGARTSGGAVHRAHCRTARRHRLWTVLLRVQGHRDAMGLEVSLRRLRTALVELGQGDTPETVRLPLNVQRVLDEVRAQMRFAGETAVG